MYLIFAILLRDVVNDVTGLIGKNEIAIAQITKSLLVFVSINCSMIIGIIIAEIAVLSWRVKSSFENKK